MKLKACRHAMNLLGFAALVFLPVAVEAAAITGGTTTVTFDTSTLSVLTGAGFTITPVSPATLNPSPVAAVFPITGGDTTTNITHSGGLTLTRSATAASLTNFNINLTNNTLFGTVSTGGTSTGNVALFDLSSSGGATLLSLNSVLASQIATVFGIPLPAGTPIGTASVAASVAPEPASVGFACLGILCLGAIAASRHFSRRR
ncbi:MAG: hypothetical protein ACJ746_31210 [Bryobacteraceae bacterium]